MKSEQVEGYETWEQQMKQRVEHGVRSVSLRWTCALRVILRNGRREGGCCAGRREDAAQEGGRMLRGREGGGCCARGREDAALALVASVAAQSSDSTEILYIFRL
jgi:hypothetical protein